MIKDIWINTAKYKLVYLILNMKIILTFFVIFRLNLQISPFYIDFNTARFGAIKLAEQF